MKHNYKNIFSNITDPVLRIIKIVFLLIFVFFAVLYLMVQPSIGKTSEIVETHPQEISQAEFLAELTPYAQDVSLSHGVRPSLLIAQAALESNWGNSQLAKESNNYFGVKNPGGKKYPTKEFSDEEWIEIKASFKEYDSVYDSVLDYADLLKNGTTWDENLYQAVIEAPTYKEAARALTHAGYATDPEYAEKVIQIIESHQLNDLDNL